MATPPFPPFDQSRYAWRISYDDPAKHIREAQGGEILEDVWNRFLYGEQKLFLAVDLQLSSPISTTNFLSRAKEAWIEIRFYVPTVGGSTEQAKDGTSLVTYRAIKDQAEATAWANHTVRLFEGSTDMDAARVEIGKLTIPEPTGEQTFIYIVPRSETSYGVILFTHHTPFDGAGTKIVMNRYIRSLAQHIDNPFLAQSQQFHWGEEVKNLLPAVPQILGPAEATEGDDYQKTLGAVMGSLISGARSRYGFREHIPNFGPGATRRIAYSFPIEDSLKLFQASRDLGFTINHIAHAAICLVCLYDNPPTASTSSDAAFTFNGLVDARGRLAPQYTGKEGYPGYCLAMSSINIPISVATAISASGEKVQLLAVAEYIKTEYAKQRGFPCFLAVSSQEIDILVTGVKEGTATPSPPWMGPSYAGDGRGETYLDPEHGGATGKPTIKVLDYFTSLNKHDPGPFFRSFSWNNKYTLSADYNEAAMPAEAVKGFMQKWQDLITLIS
ncbi:hypothetical protein NEOLEDRAFT_1057767 [Neolentinus lepideus HHB14362 ss-1]|uniref:CoA-dependent acyltransferase n=1 Tax=Neolentinus lepideus HHB14362 ss-1 TaxID=1314782 RepID=A0A165UTD9_9AGAM|nr:hypothetical protein NEOLEDRAFT_1057767 [Neolentinus lepideus HHB14362 ss-1]